jgi:RNA recognition motif-containing protein
MSKRVLYVGGLPKTTSDHQLRDLLKAYGAVSHVHIVRYKNTGKSAGYGFVEMGSSEQALSAVVALEGVVLDGGCLRLYIVPYASIRS